MSQQITQFVGRHRFLSNYWPAVVTLDGANYCTVEHAYQAAKTTDILERAHIRWASTPGYAKRLGKSVTVRPDWNDRKLQVMEDLVRQKFNNSSSLREMLLDTGSAKIIEGNSWGDRFWGVSGGTGENHLGRILEKVRAELSGTLPFNA